MYTPVNCCTSLLHLLLRHPILVVGLGLAAAATTVSSYIPSKAEVNAEAAKRHKIPEMVIVHEVESNKGFQNTVADQETDKNKKLLKEANRAFRGIMIWEQGGKGKCLYGVHPDGVSYGPTGLTKDALKDVLKDLGGDCDPKNLEEILKDPERNRKCGWLYFLNLVHEFQDIKTAVIAYNIGKTRVKRLLDQGKPLPTKYYDAIMRTMGDSK